MTNSEKAEVIMKAFGFTRAEFKTMTTPDEHNKRLNQLFKIAQQRLNEEADIQISQSMTLSLS